MDIARSSTLLAVLTLSACGDPAVPTGTLSGSFDVTDASTLDVSLPIGSQSSLRDGSVVGTCVLTDSAAGRSLQLHLDNATNTGMADAVVDADVVVAAGANTAAVTTTLWVGESVTFSAASCPVVFNWAGGSAGAGVASVGACTLSTTTAGGIEVSSTFNLVLSDCELR